MDRDIFFTLPDGRQAEIFRLRLADGFGVDITNFGGCVTALYTPDADGRITDVALGWKKPEDYLNNSCYFGALVGRTANRITAGKFTLDGRIYQLCLNDSNICSLHGGFGYSHRLWDVVCVSANEVALALFSPDGDAGYPGNLKVSVTYRITAGHMLEIEYFAESDRRTPVNLTNHTYFNLNGENYGSTADHTIFMNADRATETDTHLQPTGKVFDVTGTRYDLRQGKRFSEILQEYANGFDDNFVFGEEENILRENVAIVTAEKSGIQMSMHTTRPGVQFYMGGFLNCSGKSPYPRHSGFCLESQAWPDAVNHPEFPGIIIEPGTPHHSLTRYSFSIVK
ncbi:MAG: galactose mutarotase [Lentisphaerae bacterium]|nr:galactose mutarotase [Lentisphaerota bacterium]